MSTVEVFPITEVSRQEAQEDACLPHSLSNLDA